MGACQYYNNQGFNLPKEEDLLIWTQGNHGHIMVVSNSGFDNNTNSGFVEIVDQNASNDPVRNLNVSKMNSSYLISYKSWGQDLPVAVWFSPVNNTPAVHSNPSPTVTPQPQAQQSWWQRTLTGAKNWFINLFNN